MVLRKSYTCHFSLHTRLIVLFDRSEDASWVALNDEAATWEGVLASKAWKLLQRHLERHDDETLKYRSVVLERTLAIDQDGKIPSWLVDSFLVQNSPMLIRTMIKFDRLGDAFRYSLAVLKVSLLFIVRNEQELMSSPL